MAQQMENLKTIVEVNSIPSLPDFCAQAYTVIAVIDGVDYPDGWYYTTCSHCSKGLSVELGAFWCPICYGVVMFPMIRFKLHLRVLDETGHGSFAIFNAQLERLLDTSANKILNRVGIGTNAVPTEFTRLVGRIFKFTIKLPEYLNPDPDFHHIRVISVSEVEPVLPFLALLPPPNKSNRKKSVPHFPVKVKDPCPTKKSDSCGSGESTSAGVV